VLPGSNITMEQTRVGDGIWMPKHIEVRAAAKIFFITSLIIDKVLTYSGYRPAQTGIAATWRRPGGPVSTSVSSLSQIGGSEASHDAPSLARVELGSPRVQIADILLKLRKYYESRAKSLLAWKCDNLDAFVSTDLIDIAEPRKINWTNSIVFGILHAGAMAALFMFSWHACAVAVFLYWMSAGLGISMGYHRLHTHRSYQVPLALEYFFAVCGTLTLQGGPIFWVATHRIHHQKSRSARRSALTA
jgi:hypothetical protein